MFNPQFQYTNKLIGNISTIGELVGNIQAKKLSHTVFMDLEKDARAMSAHSSTAIEGNVLALTDVKRILKNTPEHIRDSEKEVLNYNKALEILQASIQEESLDSLDEKLILDTHSIVIDGLLNDYAVGSYRKEPVFINDPLSGNVRFLPPDHQDVPSLMKELLEFVEKNENDLHYLILAGLFHKQFVIVHPFLDGNGRTARLMTKVLLAKMGLDTFSLFSFEAYYNKNITRYFAHVGEVGNYYDRKENVDFTPWLEYFTDGIIDELTRVSGILSQTRTLSERLEEHHLQILSYLEEHGVMKDSDYAEITDRSKASRVNDFQRLIDLGKIERRGKGRSTYYVLKKD